MALSLQNPAYNRTELPLMAKTQIYTLLMNFTFWGASGSSDSEQFAVDSS